MFYLNTFPTLIFTETQDVVVSLYYAISQGRIRIECKYQQSAGSVDEKLPYLFMNFTQSIPEEEAIIVIEGNGFKVGAKEWLRKKCAGTKVSVMSLEEFAPPRRGGITKEKYLG